MNGKPAIDGMAKAAVDMALFGPGWRTSRELRERFGISPRIVRAVSEEFGEIISSHRGYKLARFATVEEIRRAHESLTSRARHILDHARRLHLLLGEKLAEQGELFDEAAPVIQDFRKGERAQFTTETRT